MHTVSQLLPVDRFTELSRAGRPERIYELLQISAEQVGFNAVAIGDAPAFGEVDAPEFFHTSWSPEWTKVYFAEGYMKCDPVITYARQNPAALRFLKLLRLPWLTAAHAQVMRHAKDFGYSEGLIVPVHGTAGVRAIATFAGPEIPSDDALAGLNLIALFAHERLRSLIGQVSASVNLSAREAEALSWLAAGASDGEIGERMGISVRTVRFHLDHARTKLGARTRSHAVAIAVYRRLISP